MAVEQVLEMKGNNYIGTEQIKAVLVGLK